MKLYKCKVRLGGLTTSEVRKQGVTAPEIILLRYLHGADSVGEVREMGEADRTHAQERDRLAKEYNSKQVAIEKVFGPTHLPLPLQLPDAFSTDTPSGPPPDAIEPATADAMLS